MNTLECLREGAVVAVKTDGFEGSMICCAYVPVHDRPVAPADLRRELGKRIPSYMLPARWMSFGALPKNANGKIDRRKIQQDFERCEVATDRQSRAS